LDYRYTLKGGAMSGLGMEGLITIMVIALLIFGGGNLLQVATVRANPSKTSRGP
jgi:hypothetical protein